MNVERDAEAVYAVLSQRSPSDPADLAAESGVGGRRLEAAVERLEALGLAERRYETGGGVGGYSFSYVRLVG